MSKSIPIILLTKDEERFLQLSVRSILKRTKIDYHLFIVDNASTSKVHIDILHKLEAHEKITVIYNPDNEWLLGFNRALEYIDTSEQFDPDFLVLSDGDVTVPLPQSNICWLEYLVTAMRENAHFGKIGLSLDLGYIREKATFKNTYQRETRYLGGPQSSGMVIAPVDTTMAIYRRDLFILPAFKMIPGHASLVKPYYYTVRTTKRWQARHLGWRNYSDQDQTQLAEKIKCFTRYAAYIDPILLKQAPLRLNLYFKLLKPLFKTKWTVIVVYYWIKYVVSHFPRNFNELQSSVR